MREVGAHEWDTDRLMLPICSHLTEVEAQQHTFLLFRCKYAPQCTGPSLWQAPSPSTRACCKRTCTSATAVCPPHLRASFLCRPPTAGEEHAPQDEERGSGPRRGGQEGGPRAQLCSSGSVACGGWEPGGCQEEEEEGGWAWWPPAPVAALEQREQQVQQPGQRPTVARLPWPRVREEVLQSGQPRTKQLEPQKRTAVLPCPPPLGLFTCLGACRTRPASCPRPPERRAAARSAMSHACGCAPKGARRRRERRGPTQEEKKPPNRGTREGEGREEEAERTAVRAAGGEAQKKAVHSIPTSGANCSPRAAQGWHDPPTAPPTLWPQIAVLTLGSCCKSRRPFKLCPHKQNSTQKKSSATAD